MRDEIHELGVDLEAITRAVSEISDEGPKDQIQALVRDMEYYLDRLNKKLDAIEELI